MGSPDIRSRWRALSKKERRFLLLLAFCLLAGVVLMGLDGSQERSEPTESLTVPVPDEVVSDGNEELEQKLEALLSQVKGAGRVQVAVTYADSAASIYAYDNSTRTTQEREPPRKIQNPAWFLSTINRFWFLRLAQKFKVWWPWPREGEIRWCKNGCIRLCAVCWE